MKSRSLEQYRRNTASGMLSARINKLVRVLVKHRSFYLMALPGILLLFLFRYLPIFGMIIAFKDFNFVDGILKSPWAGLENFRFFFSTESGIRSIFNTVFLNVLFLIVQTLCQISMAIIFHDLTQKTFKKITQTMIFFPHFLSWMLVAALAYNMFNYEFGAINSFLKAWGFDRVDVYSNPSIWPAILTITNLWKFLGYGMIIYLASLAGVDPHNYEAAMIDGASKWQRTKYISIPMIMPTAVILALVRLGRVLTADFGLFYGMVGNNSLIYSTADVLDMYVYRTMAQVGDIGMSAAASVFQSIVGFLLILGCNQLARKYQRDGAIF